MATPPERPTREVPPFEARRAASTPAAGTDPDLARILDLVGRRRIARKGASARSLLGVPGGPAAPAADLAPTPADGGAASPAPAASVDTRTPPTGAPGRLIDIERIGPSIGILRIGRPSGLTFTAGQYLRAGLAGVRRAKFTIASAPHDPYLELCVESIPGGRLTPRLLGLGPGAVLDVEDRAKGSFVLDRTGSVHLMVATGTGIAPFRSMVRDALHRGLTDTFVVLHGASYADGLPYLDELTALAAADARVRYVPTVSRPGEARNQGWTGATGRVDALALGEVTSVAGPGTRVYACGNGGMVSAVTSAMKAHGLKVSSETFD